MSTKVAILGGGMGALTAAWRLSQQPGYDVTVYQRGWRLGGKGASGRNAADHDRIEEHGLHILMGFYDRSFAVLKDCYDLNPATTHGQLIPWGTGKGYTFTPWDQGCFSQKWNGDWDFFSLNFPTKSGHPWDGQANPNFANLFQDAVAFFFDLLTKLNASSGFGLSVGNFIAGIIVGTQAVTSAKIKQILTDVWKFIKPLVPKQREIRWLWMALCFVGANLIGMLDAGLVVSTPDFSPLNAFDYKEWLKTNLTGVGTTAELGWESPFVAGIYDLGLCFGATLAAGVGLYILLRMALGYRGHLAYKMNAGMGDVVFAPLYLTLKQRGVKFRFFHRVTGLRTNGTEVTTVDIEEQLGLDPNVPEYDPLVTVHNHPCWPNRPNEAQLAVKYRTDVANNVPLYDFENDPPPSTYKVRDFSIAKGTDFDVVVLAIPVGAHKSIAADLIAANASFKAMTDNMTTVGTQAVQLWFDAQVSTFNGPDGLTISFERPFNSIADMSQVLEAESWLPNTVAKVFYFCDELVVPPNTTAKSAGTTVATHANTFCATPIYGLWPGFKPPSVVARYTRANSDPSEQYVLSESGRVKYRLPPGKSGFTNLALAGDWVQTPLNAGCLEAATYGGLAAADAILQGSLMTIQGKYVERDGDWVLRPLGTMESASMWIFALKAGAMELNTLCDKYVNAPSGNAVTAKPLVSGAPFVLLVCADVARLYSKDVDDAARGWMTERDIGFFVPITLTAQGQSHTRTLIPYLYVNNFPAVLSGREMFGFPKVLAKIECTGNAIPPILGNTKPMNFRAISNVTPLGVTSGAVIDGLTIDVRSTTQRQALPLPDVFTTPFLFIAQTILAAVGAPPTLAQSFSKIPMVFLKEFRSASDRTGACHQSLVTLEATIDDFKGGGVLKDDFEITLPSYQSVQIARTLGLGPGPTFKPAAALSLQIDSSLGFGTTIWNSP